MERERWDGTVEYRREGGSGHGTIAIQRTQGFRQLVTIEGLGQGKVTFDREGTFQGCWAMGNQIFDVNGRAQGDRSHWSGTFTISGIDGRMVVTGTFRAEKTHA